MLAEEIVKSIQDRSLCFCKAMLFDRPHHSRPAYMPISRPEMIQLVRRTMILALSQTLSAAAGCTLLGFERHEGLRGYRHCPSA